MHRLLLLIPTRSYRAADFIDAAGRLDVEVVVGSDQEPVLAAQTPGRALALDLHDPEAAAARVVEFSRLQPIDTVVSVDDDATVIAARAAEALGLTHNSVHSVETARNKYLMREALAEAGLPSPHFELFPTDEPPERAARRVPYPCVLKPVSLAGSRGVIRADDPAGFVVAFDRIRAILDSDDVRRRLGDEATQILVEGFIRGPEVAVEGLLTDGRLDVLAIFDKPDPLDGPFFEETIYVTPSRQPVGLQPAIAHMTGRAARAIGLRTGPVHAELRLQDGVPVVVEVAARSIGGLCSRTLEFGTGMSLEELILRHATGLGVPAVGRQSHAAGVMMIPIPAGGTLTSVMGVKEAEALDGIEGVTISIPIGETVTPLPEGGAYLGFIFARAPTPVAVEHALREAHGRLQIEIAGV